MYDLKSLDNNDEYMNPNNGHLRNKDMNFIADRSYYNEKLTPSLMYTKSSYVPTEGLF
ncbi:hypothetical protein [Clostridium intestinale]|jgi:hypothetical protein|uniref:Uncharacterized protein n=1 Tax=Clostridium intestinale URNW TaxID=1294142 RepID=U2N652_9CLOT|nr:hypothetical protein [Clostridium intestinale]ERK30982.1 hypothetical protein CINTURNW_2071a [Clostridium intestinale URNW]